MHGTHVFAHACHMCHMHLSHVTCMSHAHPCVSHACHMSVTCLSHACSQEMLWPGARGEGRCWEMNADSRSLRLCILARTEANTKILRSDFMVSRRREGRGG